MATQDTPQPGNGQDRRPAPGARAPKGKDDAARTAARRKSTPREPAVNAVQASRKPRKDRASRGAPAAAAEGAPAPSPAAAPPASARQRPDSDPWTVPQSVRDRFVQDGHRFFFPDGAPAFKDLGRRLTTPSENTHVVHSLIEIAYSRGWSEITVSGTERFRREAWRLARVAGLSVRGYRPTDPEQAQLVRALARGLAMRSNERLDTTSSQDPADPDRAPAGAPAPSAASAAPAAAGHAPTARIVGRLL